MYVEADPCAVYLLCRGCCCAACFLALDSPQGACMRRLPLPENTEMRDPPPPLLSCGAPCARCTVGVEPAHACFGAESPSMAEQSHIASRWAVRSLCCSGLGHSMGHSAAGASVTCSDGSCVPVATGVPGLVAAICREHRPRLRPEQWRRACRRFVDMHAVCGCTCMADTPGGGAAFMTAGGPPDGSCVRCGLRVRVLAALWEEVEVRKRAVPMHARMPCRAAVSRSGTVVRVWNMTSASMSPARHHSHTAVPALAAALQHLSVSLIRTVQTFRLARCVPL